LAGTLEELCRQRLDRRLALKRLPEIEAEVALAELGQALGSCTEWTERAPDGRTSAWQMFLARHYRGIRPMRPQR